jgi:hypothetical protein
MDVSIKIQKKKLNEFLWHLCISLNVWAVKTLNNSYSGIDLITAWQFEELAHLF